MRGWWPTMCGWCRATAATGSEQNRRATYFFHVISDVISPQINANGSTPFAERHEASAMCPHTVGASGSGREVATHATLRSYGEQRLSLRRQARKVMTYYFGSSPDRVGGKNRTRRFQSSVAAVIGVHLRPVHALSITHLRRGRASVFLPYLFFLGDLCVFSERNS